MTEMAGAGQPCEKSMLTDSQEKSPNPPRYISVIQTHPPRNFSSPKAEPLVSEKGTLFLPDEAVNDEDLYAYAEIGAAIPEKAQDDNSRESR